MAAALAYGHGALARMEGVEPPGSRFGDGTAAVASSAWQWHAAGRLLIRGLRLCQPVCQAFDNLPVRPS